MGHRFFPAAAGAWQECLLMLLNKMIISFNKEVKALTVACKSTKRRKSSTNEIPRGRHQLVIDTAQRAGLLSGDNGRIAGRVRETLI
jgi:hypothetical protein